MSARKCYGAYFVIISGTAVSVMLIAAGQLAAWPTLLFTAAIGIALVAVFEAVQSYKPAWRRDHGDRYAMHRCSHEIRWAWRLHAIHHASEHLY